MDADDWHRCEVCERWVPRAIGGFDEGCTNCTLEIEHAETEPGNPGLVPGKSRLIVGPQRLRSPRIWGTLGLGAIPWLWTLSRRVDEETPLDRSVHARFRRRLGAYVVGALLALATGLVLAWVGRPPNVVSWLLDPLTLALVGVLGVPAATFLLVREAMAPVWGHLEEEQRRLGHPNPRAPSDRARVVSVPLLVLAVGAGAMLASSWAWGVLVAGTAVILAQISAALYDTQADLELVWVAHATEAAPGEGARGPGGGQDSGVVFELADPEATREESQPADGI